jgi:hypothetical protein
MDFAIGAPALYPPRRVLACADSKKGATTMGAVRKRPSRGSGAARPARPARRLFSRPTRAAIREGKFLYIRAGAAHRFIGIWAVIVEDRVFVRSWSLKPRSWWRTLLENPRGAVKIAEREIAVRARRVPGERLNDAIDTAYLEKYHSRGWIKYAKDLARPKSRATTTELVPD